MYYCIQGLTQNATGMQQTSWAWFFIFWSSTQQLIFHLNMFLKIDSRTHSGVFKINAHIPLLLFVLLPPSPITMLMTLFWEAHAVGEWAIILQPFALSSFMFNFVKGERGAGYNISGDLNMCVYFEDTGSENNQNKQKATCEHDCSHANAATVWHYVYVCSHAPVQNMRAVSWATGEALYAKT